MNNKIFIKELLEKQEDLVKENFLVSQHDNDNFLGEHETISSIKDDRVAMRRMIISKIVDNNATGANRIHHPDGSMTVKTLNSEQIKDNLANMLDEDKLQELYDNNRIKYGFIDDFGGYNKRNPYGKINNY